MKERSFERCAWFLSTLIVGLALVLLAGVKLAQSAPPEAPPVEPAPPA